MTAQISRPGVEVSQEFKAASPSITTPTLVPCVVAPYFEVNEVLKSDGTVNDDVRLATTYQQLDMFVDQSSLPSPRDNIDEVDVEEASIRGFLEFGGSILEISDNSAYLREFTTEIVPSVASSDHLNAALFNLNGLNLSVQYDAHVGLHDPSQAADFLAANDVKVTFESDGMTLAEVADFINSKIPGMASVIDGSTPGTNQKLQLVSSKFGAGASIMVRKGGTANTLLGFSTTVDRLSVGRGLYAVDDIDGDGESPKLAIWPGTAEVDLGAADAPDSTPIPKFKSNFVKVGDNVYADGVNIGKTTEVQDDYVVMDTEQGLMGQNSVFTPHYVWVQANNLTYPAPATSTAAVMEASQGAAASAAWLVGAAPTFPIAAGESFVSTVVKDGVSLGSFTIVSLDASWTDLAGTVTGINAAATASSAPLEAYPANQFGDEVNVAVADRVGLRTKADNVGSGAALSFDSQSAGMAGLGFTTGWSDVGENVRYLPGTWASLPAVSAWAGTTAGQTNDVDTTKGAATLSETMTWTATNAADAAGLAAAIADWNAQSKYTLAYESDSAGVATVGGGYFAIRTRGENFGTGARIDFLATGTDTTTFGGSASTASGSAVTVNGSVFKWSVNGSPREFTVTFVADEDDGGLSVQQIIDRINDVYPGLASMSAKSPAGLLLTTPKVGGSASLTVYALSSPAAHEFLFPSLSADTTVSGQGRPNPDLAVDANGDVVIQSHILRYGTSGVPYTSVSAKTYISYKGLRLDMSPDAQEPGLIVWNDTATLEAVAGPVSTDNPGALMSYMALINAPSVSVSSIGVSEVSADAPNGTPAGYAKSAEFLQSKEVYALALASQDSATLQTFMTHVNFMSEPEQKGERIVFINPKIPEHATPTSLGSGTDANTGGTLNEIVLDENIAPALIAIGIDPAQDINPLTGAIQNEVYLDLSTDDKMYLIHKVVDGTTVTVRTSFVAGDGNDDAFFATTVLPTVISGDWSALKRGAALTMTGSSLPDKDGIAVTVQEAALATGFRRVFYTFPDMCKINITGLEQQVEGYYATAAIAGMVGNLSPEKPFTNYPITGLTGVVKGSEYFTEKQLNTIAAGGVYILVQDSQGAPVSSRHQLSTDMSSIEKRELSITKATDFTAKFLRTGLRGYIGRNNLTDQFIDQMSTVAQGLLNVLLEDVLAGAEIVSMAKDPDQPDTLLLIIDLDHHYPSNYVRITLAI